MTTDPVLPSSEGHVDPQFAPVRIAFDTYLSDDPTLSAQLCVTWRGRTVVDLAGGGHLGLDSITGVYSATKGMAAVVIGRLVDRGDLDLDEPVATYWPAFGAAGKQGISVRDVLAHRAGVLGVDGGFAPDELLQSVPAAVRLAAAQPAWQPGSTHGYHALTIGVVMEELVRRVDGRTLQELYEAEVRAPNDIDFFLGLTGDQEPRFREIHPPPGAAMDPPGAGPDGLQALAFNTVGSGGPPLTGPLGPNSRSARAAGMAAVGGVGSARGLARAYAAVIGEHGAPPLLSHDVIGEMSRQHSFGVDRVLGVTTAFGLGFMKPHPAMDFGTYRAFGHDGAGGALAFADPAYRMSFGYIPAPMQPPGGADPKAVRLSQLVRACIRDAPPSSS